MPASCSWAWVPSQLTRSPLRRTAQGADESVDGSADCESALTPANSPPHLGFQLTHDPDYPPPTYVTRRGCG